MASPVRFLIQRRADVPAALGFLAPAEMEALDRLVFPRRRDDFLLGRYALKRAAFACLEGAALTFADLEVRPAASGAPEIFLDGEPAPLSVSLSHRDGEAFCVIGPPRLALGCDVEIVEPRSPDFVADFFTREERDAWERAPDRDAFACLVWSAKESALKALQEGLRRDTRSVAVRLGARGDPWSALRADDEQGGALFGFHRRDGARLLTVVASEPIDPPEPLDAPASA